MTCETALSVNPATSDIKASYSPVDYPFAAAPKSYQQPVRTFEVESIAINGRHEVIRLEHTKLIALFEQKIFKRLPFPSHWESEGIAKPNMAAKSRALALLKRLLNDHQLVPSIIAASIEEGICITYDRVMAWKDRSLIVEVYNDFGVALIVTDNILKRTLYREDVLEMDLSRAVEFFQDPHIENTVSR